MFRFGNSPTRSSLIAMVATASAPSAMSASAMSASASTANASTASASKSNASTASALRAYASTVYASTTHATTANVATSTWSQDVVQKAGGCNSSEELPDGETRSCGALSNHILKHRHERYSSSQISFTFRLLVSVQSPAAISHKEDGH